MCHETCARGSPLPVRLAHVHAFFPGLALATLLLGRASRPFRFSGLHLCGSHLVLVCHSRGFCPWVLLHTLSARRRASHPVLFPAFTAWLPPRVGLPARAASIPSDTTSHIGFLQWALAFGTHSAQCVKNKCCASSCYVHH